SSVQDPTLRPAPRIASCRYRVGRCEAGFEFDGTIKEMPCFFFSVLCHLGKLRDASEVAVVGIKVADRLALGALDLSLLQLRRDGSDNARAHLVLHIEDVLKGTVKPVCPEVRTGRRVNELPSDAQMF